MDVIMHDRRQEGRRAGGVRVPTGPYHRSLEERLASLGVVRIKVKPRHVRRFAEATGRLVKADRVDALMLACYGALLDAGRPPGPFKPAEPPGRTGRCPAEPDERPEGHD
ncbi:MAG: hypothetical protein ABF535_03520 [Acetobacter sp.]